jgi:acyl carrier protein
VRYLADGNIEFLGRMDRQVKIRGFRVEPGEIEAILRRHSAVQQAVVLAAEDHDGNKRLIAYVVPAVKTAIPVDALRSFLQEHLPEQMVPAVFVALENLPLTPNGKIDQRALLDPDQARSVSEKAFLGPRNDAEEKIAAIWREILGLDQVSVDADFFDLGGHSLLATQVISRVNSAFQIRVPLRSIFDAPTVAGLAEAALQFRDVDAAEEVDGLLAELEGLSEEEVQRLLELEMQQQAGP